MEDDGDPVHSPVNDLIGCNEKNKPGSLDERPDQDHSISDEPTFGK